MKRARSPRRGDSLRVPTTVAATGRQAPPSPRRARATASRDQRKNAGGSAAAAAAASMPPPSRLQQQLPLSAERDEDAAAFLSRSTTRNRQQQPQQQYNRAGLEAGRPVAAVPSLDPPLGGAVRVVTPSKGLPRPRVSWGGNSDNSSTSSSSNGSDSSNGDIVGRAGRVAERQRQKSWGQRGEDVSAEIQRVSAPRPLSTRYHRSSDDGSARRRSSFASPTRPSATATSGLALAAPGTTEVVLASARHVSTAMGRRKASSESADGCWAAQDRRRSSAARSASPSSAGGCSGINSSHDNRSNGTADVVSNKKRLSSMSNNSSASDHRAARRVSTWSNNSSSSSTGSITESCERRVVRDDTNTNTTITSSSSSSSRWASRSSADAANSTDTTTTASNKRLSSMSNNSTGGHHRPTGGARRVSTWSNGSGSRESGDGTVGAAAAAQDENLLSQDGAPSSRGGINSRSSNSGSGVPTRKRLLSSISTNSTRSSSRGVGRVAASKPSASREQLGACEECHGGEDGADGGLELCEDCAAEAEMMPKEDKRPRGTANASTTNNTRELMSVVQRRSSVAASGAVGVRRASTAHEGGDGSRGVGIDDFEVGKPLGKGKFGIVYLAKPKATRNTSVALKLLSTSTVREASHQERINVRREADIQSKTIHPNIVRMYACFRDTKFIYFVLDYAAGGDVYKVLRRYEKGLPEEMAARIMLGAVRAVAYLHRNHIIHRDIKPENLLLDARGRVKLSDFGWAVHATPPHHEMQNTMCGTPEYVAPEMLLKEPEYTKAVDTWSLGVLNYELLTGRTPFVSRLKGVGVNDPSTSPHEGAGTAENVAAEIKAMHSGNPHAELYGRIVGWNGSRGSLFGEGTGGANVPDTARDVVLAMLRPKACDRIESAKVLHLPWLSHAGEGDGGVAV